MQAWAADCIEPAAAANKLYKKEEDRIKKEKEEKEKAEKEAKEAKGKEENKEVKTDNKDLNMDVD